MLEYYLLQNAVECQKHLASIKEWEQSNSLAHLPLSSLSALNLPGPPTVSQELKETRNKLQDSGNEESCNEQPLTDSELPFGNEQSDPLYSRPSSTEDSVKPDTSSQSFLPPLQLTLLSEEGRATPDSGTCTILPADVEPLWLTGAREEVAALMADKQRLETEYHKLLTKHRENALKIAHTREVGTSFTIYRAGYIVVHKSFTYVYTIMMCFVVVCICLFLCSV